MILPLNSCVRSTARTSRVSSTTQMVAGDRCALLQMAQGSTSVRFQQMLQYRVWARASVMARARASASSAERRRMWYASRCAVLGPMVGSLERASMSLAIGGTYMRPGA